MAYKNLLLQKTSGKGTLENTHLTQDKIIMEELNKKKAQQKEKT